MANNQRAKNDSETDYKRDMADRIIRDNRKKNDEITIERRLRADKEMNDSRIKNDETTANRRKANDRNPWRTFGIWLLVLVILGVGAYLFFRQTLA